MKIRTLQAVAMMIFDHSSHFSASFTAASVVKKIKKASEIRENIRIDLRRFLLSLKSQQRSPDAFRAFPCQMSRFSSSNKAPAVQPCKYR